MKQLGVPHTQKEKDNCIYFISNHAPFSFSLSPVRRIHSSVGCGGVSRAHGTASNPQRQQKEKEKQTVSGKKKKRHGAFAQQNQRERGTFVYLIHYVCIRIYIYIYIMNKMKGRRIQTKFKCTSTNPLYDQQQHKTLPNAGMPEGQAKQV
ncbi:hypothetical protein, unlikely [Trypanosoma brucei gambiense DAL972]|uniref:Uncharacterized protein n=1 Tax=Trypanosoma brucei gambiense (strain MHOM/CI/86/DAL972) TaxID=679716 RepID=D0A5W9_TRYB9|nr:hypothetical protein, unlikely [Trypanosoma brucei gambiense DAL972]CBH17070.1 hypothetical protein, unlikely [Trypanosoma brucei gambiense DAL972]|eukprot:XP_011779334.1 hypothetical protein, unlikely [Trypanosoma brucei gambiense DAL972]